MTILIADDDADDREMIREAFCESRLANDVRFVHDGVELMDYLRKQGKYKNDDNCPRPGLILLDLNMPKKDGREALKEIKEDEQLKSIPVVVLTTSKAEEDIFRTYNLGVNSFVTKPVKFDSLVNLTRDLGRYWFEIVELPNKDQKD
jgi:CheY-like chemotaxis protein